MNRRPTWKGSETEGYKLVRGPCEAALTRVGGRWQVEIPGVGKRSLPGRKSTFGHAETAIEEMLQQGQGGPAPCIPEKEACAKLLLTCGYLDSLLSTGGPAEQARAAVVVAMADLVDEFGLSVLAQGLAMAAREFDDLDDAQAGGG